MPGQRMSWVAVRAGQFWVTEQGSAVMALIWLKHTPTSDTILLILTVIVSAQVVPHSVPVVKAESLRDCHFPMSMVQKLS